MPCKGQTQREFILAGPGQRRTSLREVLENSFFFLGAQTLLRFNSYVA